MAIESFLKYAQKDATANWNARLKATANKGFVDGGTIVPVGGLLEAKVAAFTAVSYDGMVVRDTSVSSSLELSDNTTVYIVLDSRYHTGGDPTNTLRVIGEDDFADYDVDLAPYLLVVAKLTIPEGATEILASYIDYSERTEIDRQGRHPLRGVVESLGDLDSLTVAPTRLRAGDAYLCIETCDVHVWTGSVFDREVEFDRAVWAQESLQQRELLRRTHGSCVLPTAFALPDEDHRTSAAGQNLNVSVENSEEAGPTVVIDGFSAVVNGMYVHVPKTRLTGFDERPETDNLVWDVVFLEVWATRAGEAGPNDVRPEVFVSEDGDDLSRSLAAAVFDRANIRPQNLDSPEFRGFWFHDNGDRLVLKYRVAIASDVTSGGGAPARLAHPFSEMVALGVDGQPFAWIELLAGDSPPDYVYRSLAESSSLPDNYSYAIPLLCIRRLSGETYATGSIDLGQLTDGSFQVFDVSPISRQESGRRLALVHGRSKAPVFSVERFVNGEFAGPSGISTPIDDADEVYGRSNSSIRVPACTAVIAGQSCIVPDTDLALPSAPGAGSRLDLVVLEMTVCRYPTTSDVIMPYVEADAIPFVIDQHGNVYCRKVAFRVVDVGTETDEYQALFDAGYTTPESVVESNLEIDPGLWIRLLSSDDAMEAVYPGSYAMAIPIALVARRNSDTFDAETNPNGSGGSRPDGLTGARVSTADIVDLRRFIVTGDQLETFRAKTWRLLRSGMLRTKMCRHHSRSSVYGSMLLYQDAVSKDSGAVSGDANFPAGYDSLAARSDLNVVDGVKGHFSWADETQPYVTTIRGALDAAAVTLGGMGAGSTRLVTISAAGGGGLGLTLVTVNAPRGAVFVNEDVGGGSWKPMVRCFVYADTDDFESVADSTGDITALTITNAVSGSRNVTQFTFKMPNAWRTSTKTRHIVTYICYHGQGPDPANNLDVNRGLSVPPVALLECSQPDGAGDVLVAPPRATYTATFNGSGVVDFDLGTNAAVGFDFLMGNRSDLSVNAANGVACQDAPLSGILTVSGVPNLTTLADMADNTLFHAAPDAYISTNDDFDVIRVVTDAAAAHSKAALLLCPVRPGSGARHWVEATRGSQALRGNFVWAVYEGVIGSTGELHLPPTAFSFDGTNPVSPQSFFANGVADVDVFVWRDCSGSGYTGNNKWRLMPNQAAGAVVWSLDAQVNRFCLAIVAEAGGNGYTLSAGDTVRVVAKIHEPPVMDNYDGGHTWDATSYVAVSYMGVPYQGMSDVQESNSAFDGFFGRVQAVGDIELHTTGRVPAVADSAVSGNEAIVYQSDRATATNNPTDVAVAVWQNSVSRFAYLEGRHANGLCLAFALPMLNLAWYDNDDPASLPSGHAAGLAKWAFGHLPTAGGGTCLRYPLTALTPGDVTVKNSPTPPSWNSTVRAVVESRFTAPSSELRQGVCSAASEAALPYAVDSGLTLCLGVSQAVLCHASILGDTTGLSSMISSTTNYTSPSAKTDLAGTLSFSAAYVFRHNVDGYQGASEWSNLGVVSTANYIVRGKQPGDSVRSVSMLHVTTSVTNRTSGTALSDRAPGTAHDIFTPYGRPISR